jgi:short-subunit dehydrogenase
MIEAGVPRNSARPVALITGASAGIGSAFARKLAARGYDLILVARRKDRLDALGAELASAHGVVSESLEADLTEPPELRRVEERIAGCPQLELLVNNAGFGTLHSFTKAPVDLQDKMIRIHITATMRLSHAALSVMIPARKGAIVNVSSLAAFETNPGSVSYSASKAWVNRFTEGLDLELKTSGSPVKVQALCPGFTYTEFHDVVGIDRTKIPKWLWLAADLVVDESLKGLDRGRLIVIPGFRYRRMKFVRDFIPGALRRWVAIALAKRAARI